MRRQRRRGTFFESMPLRFVIRDLVVLLVCAVLWWLDARARGASAILLWTSAIATALATGLCGFLAHEWGHYTGARLTQSRVEFPSRVLAPLLFHFQSAHNTRRQFIAMSLGGYVATTLAIGCIAWCLPHATLAWKLSLGLAGLGALATAVLELPTFFRVLGGAPLPSGFAYEPPPLYTPARSG